MIDLRSDTVTKPTDAMRAAMAAAEVGDDVFGEDPTVNRLQDRAAEIFERESALFVPSGCMANQIAVKVHTKPGDEVIIEDRGHIYQHEMGSAAVISGVLIQPIRSEDRSGHLEWNEIEPMLHIDHDYHGSETGLICLENTHNMAGGTVMTADHCKDICDRAHAHGIPVHLDGARIFNAAVALGSTVADLTRHCDSVQFCLSKGLGAPVGSMLVGSKDFIDEARAWRKRLGGGMRQAGILAAAGLIALEESPKRLHEDHANARRLAEGLAEIDGFSIDPESVVTNIVIFDVAGTGLSQSEICDRLEQNGVLAFGWDTVIRMVTHNGIDVDDIDSTIAAVRQTVSGGRKIGDEVELALKPGDMEYETIKELNREQIEAAILRNEPDELLMAVLSAALYSNDPVWSESVCLRLADHEHFNVRGNAILGFAHIARIHGKLDADRVKPIIESALSDESEYVRGHAEEAADDIEHYLKWRLPRPRNRER